MLLCWVFRNRERKQDLRPFPIYFIFQIWKEEKCFLRAFYFSCGSSFDMVEKASIFFLFKPKEDNSTFHGSVYRIGMLMTFFLRDIGTFVSFTLNLQL